MDQVLYYASTDTIYLERMVRYGKFDMRVNHFHNEYEIFFLLEGERQFFIQNRSYQVKSGSLILVDENVIHMTRASQTDEKGHDRIILYINKDKMRALGNLFPNLNLVQFFQDHYGVYDLTKEQQQQFMEFYQELCQEFDTKKRNYSDMIEMNILRYFIEFMRETHIHTPILDESANKNSSKYQTIYAIADYIMEHYQEPINLDLLAGQFFLSRYYLSRTFKEVTGHGVNEYVNILRTKQAKRLLEETSFSISQIAQTIGYESITYFEKVFKNYMTLSPLKYRKTLNIVTYTNLAELLHKPQPKQDKES